MTPKESQVYRIIKTYWDDNNHAPSYKQIQERMLPQPKSLNSITQVVNRMCEKKILEKDFGYRNTVRVFGFNYKDIN